MENSKILWKLCSKIVLCGIIFMTGVYITHFSPLKWYFRKDCLCGRAYFHPGESYAPDEMLFQEIGRQDLSDGVVRMLGTNCERHNVHIWITIWGTTSYSVRSPEN